MKEDHKQLVWFDEVDKNDLHLYPELTEKLVEWGITSVSVNRDMIYTTREIIAAAELRLSR